MVGRYVEHVGTCMMVVSVNAVSRGGETSIKEKIVVVASVEVGAAIVVYVKWLESVRLR